MRGSTRTTSIAHRAAAATFALAAGLALLAGCSSSDTPPTDGQGSTGTNTLDPSSSGTASPGSTDAAGGGSDDGVTGGTGGGGGGGSSPIKPCAALTVAEASSLLGSTLSTTVDTETECLYEAGGDAVSFTITEEPYDAESVNALTMLGPQVEKIEGLGDAAFKVSLGADTQFHVWTKGLYVAIIVTKESGADSGGPARAMLDKILSKL